MTSFPPVDNPASAGSAELATGFICNILNSPAAYSMMRRIFVFRNGARQPDDELVEDIGITNSIPVHTPKSTTAVKYHATTVHGGKRESLITRPRDDVSNILGVFVAAFGVAVREMAVAAK